MFNIVPKTSNPSYRRSINLHCFGKQLSSFIFKIKNTRNIRDKITHTIKKKKKLSKSLLVLKFHFSWFFIRQKCSSWQKLIIGVVFRTTSAFLATFYACAATRHFIQLWGERVKVGRLIKARVFELGTRSTPLMGQRWFLKQSVKPIPITVW